MDKPRARDKAALLPQQAGQLLKEKYLRQLDQRRPGEDAGDEYATDQVEGSTRWAVDELTATATHSAKERWESIKHKTRSKDVPPTDTAPARERPANAPKERPAVTKTRLAESNAPKATDHAPGQQPKSATAPTRSSKRGYPPTHTTLNNRRRVDPAALPPPTVSTPPQSAQTPIHMPNTPPVETSAGGVAMPGRRPALVKERLRASAATIKTRTNVRGVAKASAKAPAPKVRPAISQAVAKQATRKARQTAQQHMKHQMVARAQKAAKTAAVAAKRVTVAIVKAAAALVSSFVGLLGGGFLLIALVVVVIIAAVASSPFGLFFAAEPNAPGSVSVAQAVAQVNMDYNAKLEELQAGGYDSIEIHGQAPDWPDVLAVFAVKTAGADGEGMDVATLDADRLEKLKAVFWDMTAITSYVEEIYHPGDGEDDPGWTEYILHITITPKTADAMRSVYAFTPYQNSALDDLLSDRAALSSLAGDLTITGADLADILKNLPDDLSPERREAVRVALTLVGKVNYFWGGKSHAIGWDSRWGTLQKVWAEGSSTTGTYRPYGLDCSGYVDWIFNNSMDYIIGHGGGVIMQHTYCTDIDWSEAQPGDLAFFPDDSHIGIVVGLSESGGILVAHCSSGQNNVVVTDCAASGFTAIGRPDVFD